jgi:TRAP-type C4-dicarboxylate transport system substrate-binding protein
MGSNMDWLLNLRKGEEVKRIILVTLTVLLVSVVIFGGCAKPAEEAPTAPAEPEAKTIKWRLSCFIPPSEKVALITKDWIKEVEEATDGRLVITDYWAESLVKMVGEFDAVAAGTTDISMPSLSPHVQRCPLTQVGNLIFVFSNIPQVAETILALLDEYQEFRDELLPTRAIWWNCVPGDQLIVSRSRLVQTMEDLKSMKIQVMGEQPVKALKSLGAAPLFIGSGDRYHALETGVIEASMEEWNFTWIWKLHEVTKYRTYLPEWLRARHYPSLVNIESYNELPEDIRQIFDELTDRDAMSMHIAEAMVDFNLASKDKVLEYDKKVGNPPYYTLTDAELERWKEVTSPVNEEYIKSLEEKGLPGRSFAEDAIAFAKQYK